MFTQTQHTLLILGKEVKSGVCVCMGVGFKAIRETIEDGVAQE